MGKKRQTAFHRLKKDPEAQPAEISLTDAAREAESMVTTKTTAHEDQEEVTNSVVTPEIKPKAEKQAPVKPSKKETAALSTVQELVASYPKEKEAYVAQVVVESVDKKLNFLATLYNVSKIELIHAAVMHLWDSNKEEIEKDKRRKDKEDNMFD